MSDAAFDQVKRMIEQLPTHDIERLRVWLNTTRSEPDHPSTEMDARTWGEQLVELVNTFDLDITGLGWDNQDPEIWVRNHRQTQTSRRNPGWGDE